MLHNKVILSYLITCSVKASHNMLTCHIRAHNCLFCLIFQNCKGTCEANRACVQCRIFGTGEFAGDLCARKCKDFKITPVDKLTPGDCST